MSVRGKVYRGWQRVERMDKGKITARDTITGKVVDMIPVILKYEEGGIKSGMLVGIDPTDYELVTRALSKIHGIPNSGQVVDEILGESRIELVGSPIIIPGKLN